MSLRVRLIAAFVVILTALAGLGAWSGWRLWQMGAVANRIIADNYDSVVAAQEMVESLDRQDSALLFLFAGQPARAQHQFQEHHARFAAAFERAAHNITEPGESAVITAIGANFQGYSVVLERLFTGPSTSIEHYFTDAEPRFNLLRDECDRLLTLNQEAMRQKAAAAASITRANVAASVVLTAVLTGIGIAVALVMVTSLLRAVRDLDQLKMSFVSSAAHELQTPLMSLQMGVNLLAEQGGNLTGRQMELVRLCRDESARLARLAAALLDLSKIESGRSQPRLSPQGVAALLHGAVDSLRIQFEAKGVGLTIVEPDGALAVSVDRAQIDRVLANLVMNALRATPAGGRITVSASRAGGDRVVVSVSDTGTGIPAPYVERIFDPFVQVPGSEPGGAGLGLTISRRIVEAHGGRLEVRSTEGKGTVFSFTIAVADS